jgi:hypothetical protein
VTAAQPLVSTGLLIGGAPVGHVQHLAHGAARLTLRTDTPSLIPAAVADLHAYLPTAVRAGWTLTVRTTTRVDAARAAARCSGIAVEVGPGQHAYPHALPGGMLWWIPETATLVHRDDQRRDVTAFCPTTGHARSWAVRLARQLVTVQLVHAGAAHTHAAAFTHDGGGVLVTGPAGAGKTTCLLLGLRLTCGRFVANDRVLLAPDSDGVLAYAWPAPLRAAAGTLRALGGLAAITPDGAGPGRGGEERKVDIDPARLARLAGIGTTGSTRPRLMLWPVRAELRHEPETVPADEVGATLLDTRLFLRDPATGRSSHLNHWLIPLPVPADLDRAREAVVDLLAATVPCVRLFVTDDLDLLVRHLHYVLTAYAHGGHPDAPEPHQP